MTASELKYQVLEHGESIYFFTRKTMRFFGDTMKNYGVREAVINTRSHKGVKVWALYRKRPVKHGITSSAFFNRQTFKKEFQFDEEVRE